MYGLWCMDMTFWTVRDVLNSILLSVFVLLFYCLLLECSPWLMVNKIFMKLYKCSIHISTGRGIAKISVTSRALLRNIYGWQKVIKTKEMTENSCTSKDCRFTYMLDFILKPGGKLEYQDNASLLKFKGNPSIDTCRKSGWKFVCE